MIANGKLAGKTRRELGILIESEAAGGDGRGGSPVVMDPTCRMCYSMCYLE